MDSFTVLVFSLSTIIISLSTFYSLIVSTFAPIDSHLFNCGTTVDTAVSTFYPIDNYLINCGSAFDSTVDNRRFVSDPSSAASNSLVDQNPPPNSPQIYHSARVFQNIFKYEFKIRDPGTHLVRLHFHRLNPSDDDLRDAKFHVLVDDYVALTNFTGEYNTIKEYSISVDSGKLVITFVPLQGFAFVNAIEVISAPKDLIVDTAQYLNDNNVEVFNGLTKQALETVYRINVGGPKVTPFNDSVWRTWVPDNGFLKSSDGSNHVYYSGRINYRMGGASREVGPDNVYNTARVITSKNASIPKLNMTWEFPVIEGYKYLVRVHFCDIASISLGLLYCNVYLNGNLAIKDLDLSDVTSYMLASPFYADFVVDGGSSGVLRVSVGPSSKSMAYAVDGILNGVEVMKMNNSVGSLDGELCAELVMKIWPRGYPADVVRMIAMVCMVLSVSLTMLVMHWRNGVAIMAMHWRNGVKDCVGWLKLPVDVSEDELKHSNQQLAKM